MWIKAAEACPLFSVWRCIEQGSIPSGTLITSLCTPFDQGRNRTVVKGSALYREWSAIWDSVPGLCYIKWKKTDRWYSLAVLHMCKQVCCSVHMHMYVCTGGWWHLNWWEWARGNTWSGISGMVSKTVNMVSRCLGPFNWLRSGHCDEPFSLQQLPVCKQSLDSSPPSDNTNKLMLCWKVEVCVCIEETTCVIWKLPLLSLNSMGFLSNAWVAL